MNIYEYSKYNEGRTHTVCYQCNEIFDSDLQTLPINPL